jgi:hypothetical protein
LYSYGEDFDDDGGKHSKWGVGDEGGDQVFWPVEQSQTAQRQPRREERGPYYAQTEPQTERTSFRAGQSDTSDKTLHDAVVTGDIAQVKALLSRGVDINMKNRMSWTPLHTAIQNRREEIARLLIERNPDLNAKNNRGQTPLHVAVNTGQKEIVELLISKGADVNVMAGSDNALTFAQKRRDQEIIDILVKNGAKEPSPEDLMGDRYYLGAENPYGDYQQQTSAPSRSTRGYRAVAQPVEVDILADPNEITARIKTFAGLAKALEVVDANSQRETRQWLQTRYDNRTMLLRTVQKQFEDEMDLIKEAAVSENAQKTAKAIENAVALRQQRFEATKKELLEQRREQRMAERMSGRTRGRGRVSARSSRGYGSYDEQEHDSYGRYDRYDRAGADPYGRAGRTAPGTRYPGTTDEQTEAVDAEGQNETRQWLQTNFDDKTDLAGAVNDQIRAELTAIRDIAVEESAKKTTAAIDGVLLTRHMRLEDFLAEWQEQQAEQALRQQAYDPRTRGRYQQDSRYDRGGTTGGYPQRGRSRGRRRR